ncbi:hypothetical protein [Bacillus paranthracis]|uniref:hypothetical protein n=1 Tax=Bacillus paranthracis TaxID=2026186 RepID=UPI001E5AC25D|nr:hypothetical protein [Bacillus paranthracis]MCC2441983.1 hypothetical protein [Bacillus paranthracis]
MKGIVIVGGARLIDIIDKLCNTLTAATWFDELNELISDCKIYKEELEYKKRIILPFVPIKVMKSQVLNRKPMLIRARTTC